MSQIKNINSNQNAHGKLENNNNIHMNPRASENASAPPKKRNCF